MPKKDYLKLIKSREDLISSHPAYFIQKLERIQNALYDNLLIVIKGMDVKKGAALEASKMNIEMANKLRIQMSRWLRNNGYYESITEFGKGYSALIRESKKYYKAMGLDPAFTERDLNSLASIRKNDLNFLMTRDRDVMNATYSEVLNSIYAGSDWRRLAERLKKIHTDTVLPNGQTLRGLLKKYNATYANTAFAGFDRRIQTIKARQYGLTKFLYSGSLMKDSREFCAERAGKVFSKKEIDSWQNMKWQGKAAGRNVWTFLGGFNCQHLLSPVTEEYAQKIKDEGNIATKPELEKGLDTEISKNPSNYILNKTKNKYEQMVAIDKKGKILLNKGGSKSSIAFTKLEAKKMTGAEKFYHNHPHGSSFSLEDLQTAYALEIKEMRVVAPNSYFGNVEYFAKTNGIINITEFNDEYYAIYRHVERLFIKLINSGRISIQDANKLHHHYVWKLLKRKFKEFEYGYERITKQI